MATAASPPRKWTPLTVRSKPGEQSAPQMSSAEKIRAIDGNKDGAITAVEHETASRDKFAKMDTNRDGNLTAAELQAGHAEMTGERTN